MILLVSHTPGITALMNELPTLHLPSILPAFRIHVNFILHTQPTQRIFSIYTWRAYISIYLYSPHFAMSYKGCTLH